MIIYLSYVLRQVQTVDAEQFQRIAKALADPRRCEILEHIAKQSEMGCRHLCGCFPVRQATISHHLKELASAGLVESRKDGQFVYYKTRPVVLEAYMSELRRRMYIDGGVSRAGSEEAAPLGRDQRTHDLPTGV
jgi:ArsR family transcriptional regulator